MTRVIGKMSDKLLGLVLKEQQAGACIPENGQKCACRSGYVYRFNCLGACKKSTTRC